MQGFLSHLHSLMVTMSQKSFVPQTAKSVSQALMSDRSLRPLPLSRDFDFATQRFEPKRFGLPVSDDQICVSRFWRGGRLASSPFSPTFSKEGNSMALPPFMG
jgi:hypothetical protein